MGCTPSWRRRTPRRSLRFGPLLPAAPYAVLEQICLFGLQLFFAAYMALILYHREGASSVRSAAVGLGCFLASSAWLLLGTIFG